MGFAWLVVLVMISSLSAISESSTPNCLRKLLPCKDHMKTVDPPPSCCMPLKDLVKNDAPCLCQILANSALLRHFNTTAADALQLAKSCGADPNVSLCKAKARSPSASPAIPPPPTTNTNSSNAGTSISQNAPADKSDKENAAARDTISWPASFAAALALLFC